MTSVAGRVFVFLAYLDDSKMGPKRYAWKVVSAAVIPDSVFGIVEFSSSFAMESLMPQERLSEFSEFHACELYGGYGVFEDIDQDRRFKSIEYLLGLLVQWNIKVTYGAVNLEHLSKQPHASANPMDMAFRMCARGVGDWLSKVAIESIGDNEADSLGLLIMDECDKSDRATIQNSFRSMRKRLRPPDFDADVLRFLHDDMYFGDSKYSIGIQIADLCSYFIARHLIGDDETERFYSTIEPQIVSAIREP